MKSTDAFQFILEVACPGAERLGSERCRDFLPFPRGWEYADSDHTYREGLAASTAI